MFKPLDEPCACLRKTLRRLATIFWSGVAGIAFGYIQHTGQYMQSDGRRTCELRTHIFFFPSHVLLGQLTLFRSPVRHEQQLISFANLFNKSKINLSANKSYICL
jgi:hypothetical protein